MRLLTIFLLGLFTVSCNGLTDYSNKQTDYLIFGNFYGMCVGDDCVANFKLTDGDLYKDANDSYAGMGNFLFKKLSADKSEIAEDLYKKVPAKLLSSKSQTFGCPDCVDQGGIYIEISQDGNVKEWKIDQDKDNIPSYLHDFVDEVNARIQDLAESAE